MTVQDLLHRFPEIPGDLHQEPLLEQLADRCGELLEVARRPSNCSPGGVAQDPDAVAEFAEKLPRVAFLPTQIPQSAFNTPTIIEHSALALQNRAWPRSNPALALRV